MLKLITVKNGPARQNYQNFKNFQNARAGISSDSAGDAKSGRVYLERSIYRDLSGMGQQLLAIHALDHGLGPGPAGQNYQTI